MEITSACISYPEPEKEILFIQTDENETVRVGQTVRIELLDETVVEREVLAAEKLTKKGKWKKTDAAGNGETARIAVDHIPGVVYASHMPSRAWMKWWDSLIRITPYKELCGGEESIHDHVQPGARVPEKVIAYLRAGKTEVACPGIYEHPFIKGRSLGGPYSVTDGTFLWDGDTWKYVLKYGLTLPQAFIDHVMSEAGTRFLEEQYGKDGWNGVMKEWRYENGEERFLPVNDPEKDLADF